MPAQSHEDADFCTHLANLHLLSLYECWVPSRISSLSLFLLSNPTCGSWESHLVPTKNTPLNGWVLWWVLEQAALLAEHPKLSAKGFESLGKKRNSPFHTGTLDLQSRDEDRQGLPCPPSFPREKRREGGRGRERRQREGGRINPGKFRPHFL